MAEKVMVIFKVGGTDRQIICDINDTVAEVAAREGFPSGPWRQHNGRPIDNPAEFPLQPGDTIALCDAQTVDVGGEGEGGPVSEGHGATPVVNQASSAAGMVTFTFLNHLDTGAHGAVQVREGTLRKDFLSSQLGGASGGASVQVNYANMTADQATQPIQAGEIMSVSPMKMEGGV